MGTPAKSQQSFFENRRKERLQLLHDSSDDEQVHDSSDDEQVTSAGKGKNVFEMKCKVRRQTRSDGIWLERGGKVCIVRLNDFGDHFLQVTAHPTEGNLKAVVNSAVSSAPDPSLHKSKRKSAILHLYDTASHVYNRVFSFTFKDEENTLEFIEIIQEYQKERYNYRKLHPLQIGESFHSDAYDCDEEENESGLDDEVGKCLLCNRYGNMDEKCFCTEEGNDRVLIGGSDDSSCNDESSEYFEEPATQDFPHIPWYPDQDGTLSFKI